MTVIADFLAGALLSLLLPTGMLVALVIWYLVFVSRVPETAEREEPLAPAPNPPSDGPELSHTERQLD